MSQPAVYMSPSPGSRPPASLRTPPLWLSRARREPRETHTKVPLLIYAACSPLSFLPPLLPSSVSLFSSEPFSLLNSIFFFFFLGIKGLAELCF